MTVTDVIMVRSGNFDEEGFQCFSVLFYFPVAADVLINFRSGRFELLKLASHCWNILA